jgi:hypothetical protein
MPIRGASDPWSWSVRREEPWSTGSTELDHGRVTLGSAPKGSDEQIKEDVCDHLLESGLDANDIEVVVESAAVTLFGRVRSDHDRDRAESLAGEVVGVKLVNNHLDVEPEWEAELPIEHDDREAEHVNLLSSEPPEEPKP